MAALQTIFTLVSSIAKRRGIAKIDEGVALDCRGSRPVPFPQNGRSLLF